MNDTKKASRADLSVFFILCQNVNLKFPKKKLKFFGFLFSVNYSPEFENKVFTIM